MPGKNRLGIYFNGHRPGFARGFSLRQDYGVTSRPGKHTQTDTDYFVCRLGRQNGAGPSEAGKPAARCTR